jgi:hypothetical protein
MRRYRNGRYATTGNYQAFKIMLASIVACGLVTLLQPKQAVWADPRSDAKVIEVEKVVEKPVPVPLDCKTEKCKILAYIVELWGDQAADMITIIRKCENSTFDQTRTNHNRNGSTDYGVAMVNSIHTKTCGEAFKTDWKANLDCAHKIYQRAGNSFSPWACSHVVGVKSFWQ